jgi:hypothetical protein
MKADLHKQHQIGHYPNVEDSAARDLAMAIHVSESPSSAARTTSMSTG